MDSKMGSEQMQSPPLSEATDTDVPDLKGEGQSAETATLKTESAASVATPPVSSNRRAASIMTEFRRTERYRVTVAIKQFLKSDKSALVDRKDRIDMLYEIRNKCITDLERAGMGSMRERFPEDVDEEGDRSRLVKVFPGYVAGQESPSGMAQKSAQGSKDGNFDLAKGLGRAVNRDDEEPEPVRRKVKKEKIERVKIKKEAGGESCDSLTAIPEMPKSGVVAGVAIMRGFRDARLAVNPVPETSVARVWKQIGGKWMPVPSVSPRAASGPAKRKLESVDREDEAKKIKLE